MRQLLLGVINRRRFLHITGAAAMTSLIPGCGGGEESGDKPHYLNVSIRFR